MDRKLFRDELEEMIDLYKAGRRGESRSQYVRDYKIQSRCISYLMAILHEYKDLI